MFYAIVASRPIVDVVYKRLVHTLKCPLIHDTTWSDLVVWFSVCGVVKDLLEPPSIKLASVGSRENVLGLCYVRWQCSNCFSQKDFVYPRRQSGRQFKSTEHDTFACLPGSGRPFKITLEMLNIIEAQMEQDDEMTATQLAKLLEQFGHKVS